LAARVPKPAPILPAQVPDVVPSQSAPVRREPSTWREVDLSAVVAGLLDGTLDRPVPTVGRLSDGSSLFYAGRINCLFGESGDGKTFIAQTTACQEIAAGNHVVWLDFEDNAAGTIGRLLDLGASADDLTARFHYFGPDEVFDDAAREHLRAVIVELQPSLVVIDSAGESMALEGTKPNDDDSVARWNRRMPLFLANLGPCVLFIDHIPKSTEKSLFAIGSQRKRAVISGHTCLVEAVQPFGKGRAGRAKLTTGKDRCGTFVRGQKAAEFELDATVSPYRAELVPPAPAAEFFRPTALMEKVSRFVEVHPGSTKTEILSATQGKRDYRMQAIDILVREGYLAIEDGPRGAQRHRLVRPYRETGELFEGEL
jgi:hypothetical protein